MGFLAFALLLPESSQAGGSTEFPGFGLLLACDRLGVTAARTAYVGDSPQDGETAHHAGTLAVAARWGHLMRDVSAFDVAVDRPTDLPDALGLT